MDEVVSTWNSAFRPIQSNIESISFITRGKAINQPMNLANGGQKPLSAPQTPSEGAFRRTSSGLINSNNNGPQPRTLRIPSSGALKSPSPAAPDPQLSPSSRRRPDYLAPTDFTTATVLGGAAIDNSNRDPSPGRSPDSRRPSDYFNSRDRPSSASTTASNVSRGQITPSGFGNALGKKKPPPPPPKRIPSTKPEEWVVARYAFEGQGQGDLTFREGDRIKIVKKTETDQDWWVGELDGVKGNFPANYTQPF
jgi:hypothetical protein